MIEGNCNYPMSRTESNFAKSYKCRFCQFPDTLIFLSLARKCKNLGLGSKQIKPSTEVAKQRKGFNVCKIFFKKGFDLQ